MQAPQSGQNASLVAFLSKFDIQGSRSSLTSYSANPAAKYPT